MTDPTLTMHTPAADEPEVTYQYCRCRKCNAQWQVKSPTGADTQGCPWCGAPERTIAVLAEPDAFQGVQER